MAGELMTGIAAFKAAKEALTAFLAVKSESERVLAQSDLIAKLGQIQDDYFALASVHQEIRDENMRLRNWAHEKDKYELAAPAPGLTAFRMREAERGEKPPHYVCANCFEDSQISHLQEQRGEQRTMLLVCNRCKASLKTFAITPAW